MADMQNEVTHDPKSWFENLFGVYESGLNGRSGEAISLFRKNGFSQFANAEFPTRKNEDWKYTSITPIVNNKYKEPSSIIGNRNKAISESRTSVDAYEIIFENGKLVSSLPVIDGLTIMKVEEALKNESFKAWIFNQLNNLGGTSQNIFLPLNQAFSNSGLFIKVDKNISLSKPIYLKYDSTIDQSEPFFTSPQMFIWMEQGSAAEIIERYDSDDAELDYFTNTANRIEVRQNAKLLLLKIQHESFGAHQINNTIVKQHKDSSFYHYAIDTGGKMVRNNLSIALEGSNTETFMYGSFIGYKDQHIDNQTFIDHAVPHCQSNEMYKGILTDRSRGVFNGKVLVRQDAQKTNAYQQSSSLVLTPTAVMDTKPQLEIFADDVKCSHGATIGHLDESSLFYLMTRGMTETQAKSLLKRAFISEVVDHIDNEDLRELAYSFIEEKLNLMQI